MKTVLTFGLMTMALMYLFFSIGNHSWDPMTWTPESSYWFGALSILGWVLGLLVKGLGMDQDLKERKKSPYDEVFGK